MKKTILLFLSNLMILASHSQKLPSVVKTVDLARYQGTWYEIARLPNFFEKKLKCITANYTLREDGKIKVLNSGRFISEPHKSSSSEGVAWVPDKSAPARLKVQFFWPFSGNYWIMYLDQNYRFALIGEPSLKYLWILAREKKLDEESFNMLLNIAIDNGYDLRPLIRVDQDCN